MSHYHAVVWLDHAEARIFEFSADAVERKRIPNKHAAHLHHKAGVIGAGKASVDDGYLKHVAEGLADTGEVLVVGPGNAKLELIRYLHRHAPQLEKRIVGVETADHPSDGQLVAHARKYFNAKDHMLPQA
jgi:stalled ribosome rescue protein Dom34